MKAIDDVAKRLRRNPFRWMAVGLLTALGVFNDVVGSAQSAKVAPQLLSSFWESVMSADLGALAWAVLESPATRAVLLICAIAVALSAGRAGAKTYRKENSDLKRAQTEMTRKHKGELDRVRRESEIAAEVYISAVSAVDDTAPQKGPLTLSDLGAVFGTRYGDGLNLAPCLQTLRNYRFDSESAMVGLLDDEDALARIKELSLYAGAREPGPREICIWGPPLIRAAPGERDAVQKRIELSLAYAPHPPGGEEGAPT